MIDSNLRKEYVMEGVFQWSFSKLLPPLVASELVVSHLFPKNAGVQGVELLTPTIDSRDLLSSGIAVLEVLVLDYAAAMHQQLLSVIRVGVPHCLLGGAW